MREIASTLGKAEYTKVLSEFVLEKPNLQNLLSEVILDTEHDTYLFFIQVAEKCTDLIEKCMMDESDKFYDGCLVLADRYGRVDHKAIVYIAVGSNVKGDLPRGAENYRQALQILDQQGKEKTLQEAKAYQRIGWNLEAIRYFKQSKEISHKYPERIAQLLAVQSMNSLGVTYTKIGNFEQAEKYHFTSLERSKHILGIYHPSVWATLNNIGIFYDQKGDPEKALEYYIRGLEIKRKGRLPPTTLAYSLSNIANGYNEMKRWDRAHEMLAESMSLLNKQTITPRDALALVYVTRGKVSMSERKFDEASAMFEKALEIRETEAPNSITCFESLMHLAQAQLRQGHISASLKIINKLSKLFDTEIKAMPQNTFITECLECLVTIYEKQAT